MKHPQPGMELKAWFPLATEITARFRDSQTLLRDYNTKVVVICWLPEFVIAGQPKIIDVFTCDAIDFAKARDTHYHNPPNYIVIEPENTSARTRNLRQKIVMDLPFKVMHQCLEKHEHLLTPGDMMLKRIALIERIKLSYVN